MALNENHARRIASTFSYVDQLLRAVERLAGAQGTPRSEFMAERLDLSETEAHLLLSLVETARQRMLATLDHLGLPRPAARLSARWNIMTTFRFIDISLSELSPMTLAGYGPIEATTAADVTAVAAELRDLIGRGRAILQPHEGEQLRQRLQEVPGPIGDILRAAEELSTRLGLVEVRPLIAAAAERTATSTIDIGVFGRVSSGKSSLINALIGEPVLPVGATPVTAVPLRVVHGASAVEVSFADGRTESIDSTRLAQFATEMGNPENVRQVDSILIHTPRLTEGLALLDTPGVGSLSRSGPSQAFAWLPRCDIGVVLVAVGTPLGRDEVALVGGLAHAGISVEVLLSKSDLVSESERSATLAYVEGEVAHAAGLNAIRVRPVSVMPSDRVLLDRWREDELVPLVARRERVAQAARARRVRALLAALNAALHQRPGLDARKIDLHRARADGEREISSAADELESSAARALAHAAEGAAAAWRSGKNAVAAAYHALSEPANRALFRARSAADHVLASAGVEEKGDAASRLPPLFDPAFLDALPIPSAAGVLDRLAPGARARSRLSGLRRDLDDAYGTYANRLRAWGKERLEENVERITSAFPSDGARAMAPELHGLATLIETHFPEDVQ